MKYLALHHPIKLSIRSFLNSLLIADSTLNYSILYIVCVRCVFDSRQRYQIFLQYPLPNYWTISNSTSPTLKWHWNICRAGETRRLISKKVLLSHGKYWQPIFHFSRTQSTYSSFFSRSQSTGLPSGTLWYPCSAQWNPSFPFYSYFSCSFWFLHSLECNYSEEPSIFQTGLHRPTLIHSPLPCSQSFR